MGKDKINFLIDEGECQRHQPDQRDQCINFLYLANEWIVDKKITQHNEMMRKMGKDKINFLIDEGEYQMKQHKQKIEPRWRR
jgi:hypothetical protein